MRLYEKVSATENCKQKIFTSNINEKNLARGIFVTDYGSDASMYMCKFKGIRCAHITDYYTADMCRKVTISIGVLEEITVNF